MLPFVIFQFHLIFVCVSTSESGKRLLLNDQDYAARIHQLEATVQTLVSEMISMQSAIKSPTQSGAVYIRWGKKTCPQLNGTELIYSGTVGGGWYGRTSSPAELLCLPHDPDFVTKDSATKNPDWFSSLYGAEYQSGSGPNDHDVPCAVCRASHSASVIMIPGKTSCYTGWKTEYFGRMAASANYQKASSQYTCLDENPDALEAGGENKDGYQFFVVRAVCGSLRCPPFYDTALLTCVVCSS
ncbi:uncharacterized protein [Mytilus edulis]|uniref:uncharacterized protein n=1 Tax=Mytilus edulis TaxID=6550 RepID=UPI0039EF8A7D